MQRSTPIEDEFYDHGKIVRQSKVPVRADDTIETLANRVAAMERTMLIDFLANVEAGLITL